MTLSIGFPIKVSRLSVSLQVGVWQIFVIAWTISTASSEMAVIVASNATVRFI